METRDYLRILRDEIHSAVIATVDREGLPAARVIDIMLADEGSMDKKAISIRGKVRNIGAEKLPEVFEQNPYMAEIYPQEESRAALEVFQVYEGSGEYFDLSAKPIFREQFSLGDGKEEAVHTKGYFITDRCRGCRICYSKCPQKCIDLSGKPLVIHQENCLHCGNCMAVCPFGAVEKR